jgi:uncharacterized protein (TIGR03435 family)
MKTTLSFALIVPALLAMAFGQTPGSSAKTEFDAASIKANPAETGFHFAADSSSGGSGSADPGMWRCSKCTLATLIGKAFNLQNHQFPARTTLADRTFEVVAKIPGEATSQEFQAMMQNLLKERFGLAWHFNEKKMKGYQLVVARNGSKLKESSDNTPAPAIQNKDQHSWGHGDGAGHTGVMIFNGSARYRGDRQTAADIARLLSDQLSLPVNDQTGLQGKYDVSLAWSGNVAHSSDHATSGDSGGGWGGPGHDHGGGAGAGSNAGGPSGPSLFDAVQEQLGLRLVSAEQVVARVFVVDRVDPLPTVN